MSDIPQLTMNNGLEIPQLGFGVFQIPESETFDAVTNALDAGYRSIDTAAAYRNERAVGRAIADSELDRDEIFVTTKLWNGEQGYDSTLSAFEASMGRLDLEALDLYLIHWPVPSKNLYSETWRAFELLYAEGRVRTIGVSNFQVDHLERLFDEHGVVPAINQIELHPYLRQDELREFHAENGILTEAWSPIAQGAVLEDPVIMAIADELGKTPAQVVLRWHVQLGNVVIPKSVTPSRIVENTKLFDFELSEAHMEAIAGLERDFRTGPDPDRFG
jgi:diketogulonate reductase-like aldo/keto reductase